MDRRNKVWFTLLALLLVAAVAAVVVVNNRLTNSEELLEAANMRLVGAQERNETLTADFESVSSELTAAQENSAALEEQLSAAQENGAALEAKLSEAQENGAALEAQLSEAQENGAALEAQLSEAQENGAALEAQLSEAQEAKAVLETELGAAQERSQELEAQLTEAQGAKATGYSVFTADEAVEALSARSAELENSAAEAKTRVGDLSDMLFALESSIAELTGKDAPAPEPQPIQDAAEEEPANPVRIVPEVHIPEALQQAANLDTAAIQGEIETILSADESVMTEEEKVEALQKIRSEVGGYVDDLNDAIADITGQQAVLAATMDAAGAVEAGLASAQQDVDELGAAIAEGEISIAELEAQIAALTGQGELNSAQISELNTLIEAEQARVAELSEQLKSAEAERDRYLAALEAYRIDRNPSAGEAHAASTMNNRIAVGADGTSASWRYVNNTASGNSVVLRIEQNGEELYRSEPIAPGAELSSFTLSRALTSGEQDAVAVISVCDADGSVVSSQRVSVTIIVE